MQYDTSFKVPIWLSLTNVDTKADDILIIFKAGDDLRQDMLTLQIFEIMDQVNVVSIQICYKNITLPYFMNLESSVPGSKLCDNFEDLT